VDLVTVDASCGLCVRLSPLTALQRSGAFGPNPAEDATRAAAAAALTLDAFAQGFAGATMSAKEEGLLLWWWWWWW